MDKAKLVTVWSAPGSPGRSTVACALATELAEAGKRVLLIDADTYAPSIDLQLGLNDHPAGLAAACRLIAQERFDLEQFQRLSMELAISSSALTVMTGLSSAKRWPEISGEKLSRLVSLTAEHFDYVLLDVAPYLEADSHSQNSLNSRNQVSRWAVANSHQVVAVCGADPISISRHLESSMALAELRPSGEVLTVINRLRTTVLGNSAKQQILETLSRMGQIQVSGFIPDDQQAADFAIRDSIPISMAKRSSQARQAIALFTRVQILGELNRLDGRLLNRPVAKLG